MPPDDPGTAQEAAAATDANTAVTDAATVSAVAADSLTIPAAETATSGIAAVDASSTADVAERSPQASQAPQAPSNDEKEPQTATSTAPPTAPLPPQPAPSVAESSVTHTTAPDTTLPSTTTSDQPATVATDAPASEPQHQNGDSKAPENDVDMANYPPSSYHVSSLGYPPVRSIPSTTSSVTSTLPTSSAYGSTAGIATTTAQYTPYPATTVASQSNDGYRVSPVPSNNSVTLPSMRTIESITQPQQRLNQPPVPHHTASMGTSNTLASVPSTTAYYPPQHSVSLPSNYGLGSDSLTRYPLPHDPLILGSRASKKEIKRRTKTGCLTCRKRRIKCDETHPTCNNCKKSKRECLGYDPIFRQQPGGQPNSHIQPAPTAQTPVSPSVVSPSAANHSPASVGPPPSNSYGSQPSMLPSSYSTTPPPTTHQVSPPTAHTNAASYSSTAPQSVSPLVKAEPGHSFPNRAESSTTQPYSAPGPKASLSLGNRPQPQTAAAKHMKINDIIDLLGPPPPPQQIRHTDEMFNEITKAYHEMYAGGLSAFLETTWYYFADNGKMSFPKDNNLIEHMATFLKILDAVKANDHTQMAYSGVLETRIVWELACTANQTPERTNQAMRTSLPPEGDAVEARNRLRVIEALLCGEYLTTNPLAPPVSDPEPHRTRQFDFWFSLAEFVLYRDNPESPHVVKVRDDALNRMRHLLDGRENRDVLYSIAVVRELAPSYGPTYGNAVPQHVDESDPKSRLAVASRFILDEAQVTGGTTNVVRRFSDIASRAFVNPGVNIARR